MSNEQNREFFHLIFGAVPNEAFSNLQSFPLSHRPQLQTRILTRTPVTYTKYYLTGGPGNVIFWHALQADMSAKITVLQRQVLLEVGKPGSMGAAKSGR